MRPALATALVGTMVMTTFHVPTAAAFDWNSKTVTHQLDLLNGRMKVESGHPLATARAFELAMADATARAAMVRMLGNDPANHRSDALQTVLFGSWLNEVRTNLDMGGSRPLEWAAQYLEWRYRKYLDGREHSDRWQEDTGWSSSNYQHSMLVTSIDPANPLTQDDSFGLIEEYSFWATTSAILNLTIAVKGREEGTLSLDDADLNWISGLRYIGSLFHMIEDSSVACTEASHRHVTNCKPGDGHGIIKKTSTGHLQVTALSSTGWYEREVSSGPKPHAALDDLYRRELIDEVFGEFDPAKTNGALLAAVAKAVDGAVDDLASIPLYDTNGDPNPQFDAMAFSIAAAAARDIHANVIMRRYAAQTERVPLPPIPGRADGYDDDGTSDEAGGCTAGGKTRNAVLLVILFGALVVRPRRRR